MTTKPLLDVLSGVEPVRRPVWLMRQAGRYLPEYRAVRSRAGSFLKLCYDPELACEVTLQPLRRFELDAAILFSDILVVPHAMGLGLDFLEGEGPRLETVCDLAGVAALVNGATSAEFANVFETVERVRAALDPAIGFIGFCGAPWTVASYMIEGGSSKRLNAVNVAIENPPWFGELMQRLVETSVIYLLGQIRAGVEVVQIFDSWAGDVPPSERQRLVIAPIASIIAGVRAVYPGFPVIVFARGVGSGHAEVASGTAASAIGVEEDVVLADVLSKVDGHIGVQGNLAPGLMLESDGVIRDGVRLVLEGVPKGRHIFNLGHGIVPQVRPEAVTALVAAVREWDGR